MRAAHTAVLFLCHYLTFAFSQNAGVQQPNAGNSVPIAQPVNPDIPRPVPVGDVPQPPPPPNPPVPQQQQQQQQPQVPPQQRPVSPSGEELPSHDVVAGAPGEFEVPEEVYRHHHPRNADLHHDGYAHNSESEEESSEEDGIVHEWDAYMSNFVPDMLVTFKMGSRSDEYFYHDVEDEGELVRGGYFVSGAEDSNQELDFTVMDPESKIIIKKRVGEALFRFTGNTIGTYTFVVSNKKWYQSKTVTFAVGVGNDTALTGEEVSSVTANARVVNRMLQDIQSESQVMWGRQRSHMQIVTGAHQRMFWFALLQFVALLSITAFQVYSIRNLLSNKRPA